MVRENMKKTAETSAPLLTEIAERWSPRAYDTNYEVSKEDLTSILEAGRWAPSANNLQPWRFSVVTRGEELHTAIVEQAMSGFNAAWVPSASLVIFISVPAVNQDGNPYPIALFDAGLAAQNIMIQAQALALLRTRLAVTTTKWSPNCSGLKKTATRLQQLSLARTSIRRTCRRQHKSEKLLHAPDCRLTRSCCTA